MKLTDQEEKLFRLALDSGAYEGEYRVACTKGIESLRRRGVRLEDVFDVAPNAFGETPMPFGKFKGKKLSAIDPSYLMWVLANCTQMSANIRICIEKYLKSIE